MKKLSIILFVFVSTYLHAQLSIPGSNGFVGINSTAPASRLTVNGAGHVNFTTSVYNADNSDLKGSN